MKRDVDAELRYHFDRMVRESIAAGLDRQEAKRRARLEFGGVDQVAEECRDVRGRWLEDFAKDLRYTARTLRRSPGFLAVAVLSLALGIGANTAIFTLINAVMLQPLPVAEPHRLLQITRLMDKGGPGLISYPIYEYFRDNLKSVSGVFATMQSRPVFVLDGVDEIREAELVSGGYFSVLGLTPAAGRLLEAADDVPTAGPVPTVIGYRYWQNRFAQDPATIGRTFVVRDRIYRIVGVMPRGFEGVIRGRRIDLVMPLAPLFPDALKREVTANDFEFLARLKPDATREQAAAETQTLWSNHVQERLAGTTDARNRQRILAARAGVFDARTGVNPLYWDFRRPLLLLMGIVGLVLLLACANLSALLLARAASRQREISIRLAIGAGRGRLVRQFLTESLLLAALGGVGGFLMAGWLSRVLAVMLSTRYELTAVPDGRVLAFTAAISMAACLLAGMAPALHAVRTNLNPALKEGRAGQRRTGNLLVVAQLSISMVLVVGATLFIGTLANLYSLDRGFRSEGVLTFWVRATKSYPQPRTHQILAAITERLAGLPGALSASAAQLIPVGGNLWIRRVRVDGSEQEAEDTAFNAIAPQYFTTIGTPLLLGREFTSQDTLTAKKVAIVNDSFARRHFADRSPLGQRIVDHAGEGFEIVGVVRDAVFQDLRTPVLKTVYISWTQRSGDQPRNYTFLVRVASGSPMRLAPALDRLVKEIDPGLMVERPRPYSEVIHASTATERVMAALGGFFGVLALMVACLGMFGVMAFQVSRRINELGVRMALGATRRGIFALVFRDVGRLLAAGLAIGGCVALALTGLARTVLFGVTPTDPAMFAIAAGVLAAAAMAAAWIPARRASRVDPMAALRHE